MNRALIITICLFLFYAGCSNSRQEVLESELRELKVHLEQREKELESCRSIESKIEKLQQMSKTVSMSSLRVLEELRKLDKNFYESKYITNLRLQSPKPKTEDIVKGYLALIGQIEFDLKKKNCNRKNREQANCF